MSKFKVFSEKGFQMTFENGLTISVMFGAENYCEKRRIQYKTNNYAFEHEGYNSEVAVWDKDNNWFDFKNDQVVGYLNTNDVALIINEVSKADSLESLKNSEIIKRY